jgi:hypothetical protein
MATLVYELSACVDCLMLVANGDVPDDRPELDSEIDAYLQLKPNQHLVCSGGDSEDDEFSWSRCECCGSSLGGSRHQLAVLES